MNPLGEKLINKTISMFMLMFAMALQLGCGGSNQGGEASTSPIVQGVWVEKSSSGEPRVTWAYPAGAQSIDGYSLSRATSLTGLSTFSFLASFDFPTNSYVDLDVQDGVTYAYQVTCVYGGREGKPRSSAGFKVDSLAPQNITAAFTPSGVQVSWTNRCASATSLTIQGVRSTDWSDWNSYPYLDQKINGDDSSFLDPDMTPGPRTYQIYLSTSTRSFVSGAHLSLFYPSTGAPAFEGSRLALSSHGFPLSGLLTPSGAWALAYRDSPMYSHLVQSGDSWLSTPLVPDPRALANPSCLFDGDGFPHYVYVVGSPAIGATRDIVHAWQDSTGWKSEVVGSRALYDYSNSSGVLFAMNANKKISLVWQLFEDLNGSALEYATNENGHWIISRLFFDSLQTPSSTYTYSLGSMALTMSPNGTSHLAVLCGTFDLGNVLILKHRAPMAAWTEEIVPTGPLLAGGYDPLSIKPLGDTDIAIAYERNSISDPGLYDTMLITSLNQTWTTPVRLTTRGFSGASHRFWLATTRDGSRIAVAAVPAGLEVYTLSRGSTSPNKAVLSGDTIGEMFAHVAISFTPANKVRALLLNGHETNDTQMNAMESYIEAP